MLVRCMCVHGGVGEGREGELRGYQKERKVCMSEWRGGGILIAKRWSEGRVDNPPLEQTLGYHELF